MPGTLSRSRRDSVDFPVPDGAEMTNRVPRRGRLIGSLEVLDLLADLLGLRLEVEGPAADLEILALARDRVRLPVDLLEEEVHTLADRLAVASRQERAGLLEVTGEPDDLLGDVGPLGQERRLLR